jgi:hypothetical protein
LSRKACKFQINLSYLILMVEVPESYASLPRSTVNRVLIFISQKVYFQITIVWRSFGECVMLNTGIGY